ncbi:Gfo/Idh/MocA family oxidoreductase [Lamprobacter modestohalophilus]|uniref:Gfo/Idh/MocA family protein n=1 Tax=Lamprobacter modestohalophilus TaxID=1064514 RepID=UPI002ADEF17B|nr:Gfo/Idh/MocA family oxidoreductase [Lamprobacter modestohalophilus]MEA1052768.1 Gfo/Idh/MocA family oxidoreductase [Lamprobacter modestohalophilus]
MSPKINIGVLGCSQFALRAVIPSLNAMPDHFQLIGIASRDAEKARASATQLHTQAFNRYETLLNNKALDAIYIPLPNALHAEWIKQALNHGLHVLAEKPLACSANEVQALYHKAQTRNLVLLENFQFRFHRQFSRIKEIITRGTLGELRCIRSSFGFPPFSDRDNIRYQAHLGGGALLDAGAYPIRMSLELLGEDIRVSAARWHLDPDLKIDLWGGGFIQQDQGNLFSEIAFGFDHFYQCSLDLWGSRGHLSAKRIFTAPPHYTPVLTLETDAGIRHIEVPPDNHFINMLMHFYALIQNPSLATPDNRQTIRQAALIEEFRTLANA